jgi:hypothetical protein
MKKILALLLMIASTTVFADVGLFFDGTARFARTGVIQASFPDVPLISCPSFKSCEQFLPGNMYIGVVYSDFKKMKTEVKKRERGIYSAAHIYNVHGNGFKIIVDGITDNDGRGYLLLGVKTARKKITYVQKIAIAQALTNEIELAYNRAGF